MIKNTLHQTANFELREYHSVGRNNTPFEALEVVSTGLAKKHVVRIDLNHNSEDFNGKPVRYKYTGAEVSHGMRCASDTLNETREYIGVLTEAVIFVENILPIITKW